MIKFSIILKTLSPLALPPYKGSTLRGGFGHAFKKVVCTVRKKECGDCLLKTKCIYSYVFETPPPEDSQILRKYEKAPHPFVIEPPLEAKNRYAPGDTLTFGLILMGKAVEYLPYFILAFDELGKTGIGKGRGKYELVEASHSGLIVYDNVSRVMKNGFKPVSVKKILEAGYENTEGVSIDFLTPTRIVVNEDLVVDLEFHHLARSLLRRLSTVSYFHYGERLNLDFKGLIERAGKVEIVARGLSWHDWERYSSRQDARMKLGGFLGRVAFRGELTEFMPFLKAGEKLHIGKGTSFGLGKYRIKEGEKV